MDHTLFDINDKVIILMLVLWVVTTCILLDGHQRFGGKYYLHLQGEMEILSSKTFLTTSKTTRRHSAGDSNQYFTAAKTSGLKSCCKLVVNDFI
jgi:hypothetical protein